MYTFTEIANFDIDDYLPYIGWLGRDYHWHKIYSLKGFQRFFLHDEKTNRLSEFLTGGERLKSMEEADVVIEEYLKGS